MSDRELLELAAKAAEVGPLDFDYPTRESHGMYFGPRLPTPSGVIMAMTYRYWNPLTDDGDALRLAVKCNLTLMRVGTYPAAVINDAKLRDTTYYSEDCVRRAIVAAAAEIGKSLR